MLACRLDRGTCYNPASRLTRGEGGGSGSLQLQQSQLLGGQLKAGLLHGAQNGIALQQSVLGSGGGGGGSLLLEQAARGGNLGLCTGAGSQTTG